MRYLLPTVLLLVVFAAIVASLVWANGVLPPQVASHFGAAGNADGWMPRDVHLTLMGAIGIGLPLFMVGIFYGVRYLPASVINIPHREYWLAPERRRDSDATMLRFGLWFALAQACFLLAIHLLVVQANLFAPARLGSGFWVTLGAFLAFVVVWLVLLWRRFRMPGGPAVMAYERAKNAM